MKTLLTFVTQHQTQLSDAERTAGQIRELLGAEWHIVRIEKYHKFDDAFMIDLECSLTNDDLPEVINRAIVLTDRIVSPWLAYYDSEENTLELIFNHDANTRGRTIDHSVIRWGQWQTVRDNDIAQR
ncbi:MAG: hypothetical protein KA247_05765 [Bacteroidetes bacterium]|nr:hypothetical protein [Bacteroidota bacterium]